MKQAWDERKRVLLIAPRCAATRAIVQRLRSEGFVVDEAPTAPQAFARVDFMLYDVVIAHSRIDRGRRDVLRELARFVRRRRPEAGLIEMSGCSAKPGEECCEAAPFRARILPCGGRDSALVQAVHKLVVQSVKRSEFSPPAVAGSGEQQAVFS